MSNSNVLELEGVRFYSGYDESAFFDWLRKICCIKNFEGRGSAIYLIVDADEISENDLRELLAVFRRYGIPMRQLMKYEREEFSKWFRDKKAYWYPEIFSRCR